PRKELVADREAWRTKLKSLSSLFKSYPKIRESSVFMDNIIDNRYFVNSEGSKFRVAEAGAWIVARATAQGDDGMKISDSVLISAADEKALPPLPEIEKKVKHLAEHLSTIVASKDPDLYQGPVLFEGRAAASFFNSALAPHVVSARPSDSESASK